MKKVVKRIGIGVGGLLVLVLIIVGGVFGFSSSRINKVYTLAGEKLTIPTDSAAIERGHHFAVAITKCLDCHGPGLSGKIFIDDPAMGRLTASNLTTGKGGVGAKYTDEGWVRAIRHGVKHDGKPALFMPSEEFNNLNDEDLADIIAYVKSVPAVDNELPPTRLLLLSRLLYVVGKLPLIPVEMIDHNAPRPAPVAPAPTAQYGEYLAAVGGCKGCHGANLAGGHVPGTPPSFKDAQNLTPTGIGSWTEADFTKALKVGARPDGTKIDEFMPWIYAGQMTDDEIHAVWLYLKTLPAAPTPKS
jgi:mono/diheme cytochrome c family protein